MFKVAGGGGIGAGQIHPGSPTTIGAKYSTHSIYPYFLSSPPQCGKPTLMKESSCKVPMCCLSALVRSEVWSVNNSSLRLTRFVELSIGSMPDRGTGVRLAKSPALPFMESCFKPFALANRMPHGASMNSGARDEIPPPSGLKV